MAPGKELGGFQAYIKVDAGGRLHKNTGQREGSAGANLSILLRWVVVGGGGGGGINKQLSF